MRFIGPTAILSAVILWAAPAQPLQRIPVNYDESKVGQYTLPDPLVTLDSTRVRDAATWNSRRRPELIRLFEENVYGRSPGRPSDESFEVFDLDRHALGGKAVRKQVTVYFSRRKDGPREDVLIYIPAGARAPVPVVLSLNFMGNQAVMAADAAVKLPMLWDREHKTKHQAAEDARVQNKDFGGAVEKTLARGYGFATIYYGDIEPDFAGGMVYGVRPLYFQPGQVEPGPEDWGALAAWGWGMSRAIDYMETDREIDAKRVAILGQSRLGKTVLWAGARDTRVAMVLANCSGEGGAALARRWYGETVKHMNVNFPYQFCTNYQKYGDDPARMPVDTHELIALLAPRPVYLGTAAEDQWSDPKGEFLASVAAEPVYRLLGKRGLETDRLPPLNEPILHDIAYHIRSGKHEITAFDWDQFLRFADMHLARPPASRSHGEMK
ncbi:MAG TPA: hypothetical protein VMH81_11510 [Bryobacteraceae bacterium]|nr:hypothetical protein [Bryobacteraceae bacterium]